MSAATWSRSVRDLVEIAIHMVRTRQRKEVEAKAEIAAEERVLDALVGEKASAETRQKFRVLLREGKLDDKEIEVEVTDGGSSLPTFEIPGMPGAQMGMVNLGDIFGKAFGGRTTPRKMTVADSHDVLVEEEADKLLDEDAVVREAIDSVEQNGIVFLDEIDKICARSRPLRRRCEPRGRAARPAAADRGDHGRDQARHGRDQPRPVRRLGRVPPRQAVRPPSRAAGPPADPGRAQGADRGKTSGASSPSPRPA